MISLFQRAAIRRLFYTEHWPIGTMADAVGVHHETVRRALNRDEDGLRGEGGASPCGAQPHQMGGGGIS